MTTVAFITKLFYQVDDRIGDVLKQSQACLYPGEVVTLAILCALAGTDLRAWRWLPRNYRALLLQLPVCTRLSCLFNRHRHLIEAMKPA